ncbi:Tim44 domain-containing protein [Ottowia testudinis]|uniref:Tim44 domain-containing protein n=1 Tax=Ottowia testudinis TaxID=2816950 RepID=A0A975H2D2_9BURK|nr:Tim44-like domain-containing protein [Ottowia testudinis]QTD44748.1 Tim44 domain-containing protein [Ottowia testudinis]
MKLKHIVSRLFTLLLAVVLVGAFTFDAEARRLGGGKSMGRQSSNVTQREAARTPPAAPAQQAGQTAAGAGAAGTAAAGAAARKPWGAMLGGLAAGLGLAWLAHSLGLGAAFGNFLLILLLGVVVLAVIGMIRRSRAGGQPSGGLAYQGAAGSPVTPPQYNPTKVGNDASARPWEGQAAAFDGSAAGGSMIGSALGGPQSWGIPADFDIGGFTDAAKRNFITLQDAWDRSDIPALRAMMTDGMLAEIQSQLAERERSARGQVNRTEVQSLNAQLLGIEETDDAYMASVEFSGVMVEDPSAGPNPFREVWNMTKPRNGRGGWLVAGVQALQ